MMAFWTRLVSSLICLGAMRTPHFDSPHLGAMRTPLFKFPLFSLKFSFNDLHFWHFHQLYLNLCQRLNKLFKTCLFDLLRISTLHREVNTKHIGVCSCKQLSHLRKMDLFELNPKLFGFGFFITFSNCSLLLYISVWCWLLYAGC